MNSCPKIQRRVITNKCDPLGLRGVLAFGKCQITRKCEIVKNTYVDDILQLRLIKKIMITDG